MENLAHGKSHAKIILIGEHAVVYGQPAIALPLPELSMVATVTGRASDQVIIAPNYQGPLAELTESYEGVRQLIIRLLRHFEAPNTPFTLRIESKIPQERGMGSSAATAIAITRAFFAFFNAPISNDVLQHWANVEEAITHGSPSGIDAATAAHDVPIWFIKGQVPTPTEMNLDGILVIADTGIHGQTGLAVSVVREQLTNAPKTTQPHIDALGDLAHQAQAALQVNALAELGAVMNQAHTHLDALGVSHPHLDKLVKAARDAGAYGAKLTGGGVGGAMIALVPDQTAADDVIAALETAGAQEIWLQHYTAK